MRFLFRCDGNSVIGLGHVVRCLNISQEIYQNDVNSRIYFLTENSFCRKIIKDKGFSVIPIKTQSYEKDFLSLIEDLSIDVLVLDIRNDIDSNFIKKIKTNVLVVSVDDPEDKIEACDVVLYPPIPQVSKRPLSPKSKPKLLAGWKYVSVADQFKSRLNNGRKKSRILITCGSSDPNGYTEMILGTCLRCLNNVTIDVVLGANYFKNNSNCILTKYDSTKVEFHTSVDNLEYYLINVDFAILTYGQTAFEAFCTGTPSVLLPISADHYQSSQSISAKGFGLSVNYPVELIDVENKVVAMNRTFKKVYSKIVKSKEFEEIRKANISNAINICYEEKGGY